MLTVLEAINLSAEYLNKKGIESPKLNAELLLARILNCKRLDLYLSFDRPLKQHEIENYRELLKRRGNFEPLQYIVGSVEFYAMNFNVNSSALIPRPETEILVETVIESLSKEDNLKILDVGTGSGIIAVCLAKHLPNSFVTAVDISVEALTLAEENSRLNGIEKNIEFIKLNILNYSGFGHKFDVLVSNPPYVSANDYEGLRPELKVFEPRGALTDNSDGLSFYRGITAAAQELLTENGKMFFELGQGQADEVSKILELNNFININIKKDYLGIDRVISGVLKC